MAHDLRTPLSAAKLSAQLIIPGAFGGEILCARSGGQVQSGVEQCLDAGEAVAVHEDLQCRDWKRWGDLQNKRVARRRPEPRASCRDAADAASLYLGCSPQPRQTIMNVRSCSPSTRRRAVLLVAQLVLLGAGTLHAQTAQYVPGARTWERRTPQQVGLDAAAVDSAVAFAIASESTSPRDLLAQHLRSFGREPHGEAVGPFRERGPASGLIIRRGYIVAEWGEPDRVDNTFSVTKSFLSTTVGLAWDRGLIPDLNRPVRELMAPVLGWDSGQIDRFGGSRLHVVGEFIAGDPGREIRIDGVPLEMLPIQQLQHLAGGLIFLPLDGDKTFSEMTPEEKLAVSHRGNAFRKLSEHLREFVEETR